MERRKENSGVGDPGQTTASGEMAIEMSIRLEVIIDIEWTLPCVGHEPIWPHHK